MDCPWSDHQARVNCPANDSAQRVPGSFVEPIQEIVKPMLDHIGRSSVVEPEQYNDIK